MPPLPTVNNVMRLDIWQGAPPGGFYMNRFFVEYAGGAPAPTDMVNFCDDWMTEWATHMASKFSSTQFVDHVFAEDLASNLGSTGQSTHAAVNGTDSADIRSIQDCLLMKHHILRRYRGGKPRTYFSGFARSEYADDLSWDPAFTAGFLTNWNAFVSGFLGHTHGGISLVSFVNVSYYHGHHPVLYPSGWTFERPIPRETALTDLVQSFSVENLIATQRRRIRGG